MAPWPPGARGEPSRTRHTHPLLLPAADGHRGSRRGAVPELGRLPGSQQAAREPAGPLSGHCPPRRSRRWPGARVSPAFPAPTFSPRRGSGSGTRRLSPPLPRSTRKRRVLLSGNPTPPPTSLRKSFATTFPTRRAARARWRRLERGRGTRVRRLPPAPPPRSAGRPGCPRRPWDGRRRGRARGGQRGLRGGGSAHSPGPHLEVPDKAGALTAFADSAPTFLGWRVGAGPAQFALPP